MTRTEAIEKCMPIAKRIGRKIGRRFYFAEPEDFEQQALLGMTEAANRISAFRCENEQLAFMLRRAIGSVWDFVRVNTPYPRSFTKLKKISDEHETIFGKRIDVAELASKAEVNPRTAEGFFNRPVILNFSSIEDDSELGGKLLDVPDKELDIIKLLDDGIARERILRLISCLHPKHQIVMTLYYFEDWNCHDVASLIGVSDCYVSMLLTEGVERVRGMVA